MSACDMLLSPVSCQNITTYANLQTICNDTVQLPPLRTPTHRTARSTVTSACILCVRYYRDFRPMRYLHAQLRVFVRGSTRSSIAVSYNAMKNNNVVCIVWVVRFVYWEEDRPPQHTLSIITNPEPSQVSNPALRGARDKASPPVAGGTDTGGVEKGSVNPGPCRKYNVREGVDMFKGVCDLDSVG